MPAAPQAAAQQASPSWRSRSPRNADGAGVSDDEYGEGDDDVEEYGSRRGGPMQAPAAHSAGRRGPSGPRTDDRRLVSAITGAKDLRSLRRIHKSAGRE